MFRPFSSFNQLAWLGHVGREDDDRLVIFRMFLIFNWNHYFSQTRSTCNHDGNNLLFLLSFFHFLTFTINLIQAPSWKNHIRITIDKNTKIIMYHCHQYVFVFVVCSASIRYRIVFVTVCELEKFSTWILCRRLLMHMKSKVAKSI